MGIVTVSAQKIPLLSVPLACSPAVNTGFPIPKFRPMALAAEFIGFLKIDQFSAGRVQHISIIGIVTIHTPPVLFIVFEEDIIMKIFELSPLEIGFHIGVTFRAGKNVLTEGRGRDLDIQLFFGGRLLSFLLHDSRLVARHQ
jgi:hypothetical protein